VRDERSKKIALVCHCVLNQNAKIEGIARYPGTFRPVVERLLAADVGIYQLPCPEMTFFGISRWSAVKDQYNSPFFRNHAQNLADRVVDELVDYERRGYRVLCVIGMNGSPACGVDLTPQAADEPWGGRIPGVPARRLVSDKGTFMEVLSDILDRRGLGRIPFIGLPEVAEAGDLESALSEAEALLRK
jgi:predicted secreted protein